MNLNSNASNSAMHSNNLVGPKPVVIALTMDVNQKKMGCHPFTPVIVERNKNGENARMKIGLLEKDMDGKRHLRELSTKYRCIGCVIEGNDKVSSTHAFAGRVAGCMMQGSADAGRVLHDTNSAEISNTWGILEDIVADFDTEPSNEKGEHFYYLGFRKFNASIDDPADIVGKAMSGKNTGDRTAPIFINTTM